MKRILCLFVFLAIANAQNNSINGITGQKITINSTVAVTTTPYDVLTNDSYIPCNATSQSNVINLPASTGTNRAITVKKTDSSTNTCTISRAGSDTIDGATSIVLTAQYMTITVYDRTAGIWDRSQNSTQMPSGSVISWNGDVGWSRAGAKTIIAGNGTAGNITAKIVGAGFQSSGTKYTASGCTNGTTLGGATAGSFLTGASGTCVITITMGDTALGSNGWSCWASDATTAAGNPIYQSGGSTSTAILTLPAGNVSGDLIRFGCIAY